MMKKITFKHIALVLFTIFSIGMQAQNSTSLWSPLSPNDVELQEK